MRRGLTSLLVAALLFGAAPLFAQSKAKATNVPEIPFDSVANFFSGLSVHVVNFEEREIFFTFFWGTNLATNRITGFYCSKVHTMQTTC